MEQKRRRLAPSASEVEGVEAEDGLRLHVSLPSGRSAAITAPFPGSAMDNYQQKEGS
jgi:hypothetical protein